MSRSQPHVHDDDHRPGCLPGYCDWFLANPAGDIIAQCQRQCFHFLVISPDEKELRYCWQHGAEHLAARMGKILWRGEDPVYDPPDEPISWFEYVYFMRRRDGLVKIGKSKDPTKRAKALGTGAGALEIIHLEPGGYVREHRLHDLFAADRIEGEWFVESDDVQNYLAGEGAERSVLNETITERVKRTMDWND